MQNDFVLPWGKYKDRILSSIPSGYLKWLSENCEDDNISTLADEEYRWRDDYHEHFWGD